MEIDWNKFLTTIDCHGVEPGEIFLPPATGWGRGVIDKDFRGNNQWKEALTKATERPTRLEQWYNKVNNMYNEKGGITMFNNEDRVIVVKNEYEQFISKEGVIREVTKSTNGAITFGVEFDDLKVGHDLDGKCEFGKGWYVLEDEIELAHKSKLCRMIVKDEELIKVIKDSGKISFNGNYYEVRKNGALTFLTQNDRKVFVYKDKATSPLILNCTSEDDRIVVLHLMEAFRILPMTSVMDNKLIEYIQALSDALEAKMFPVEVPVVEVLPVAEEVAPVQEVSKVYQTEEEIYAELGITKA